MLYMDTIKKGKKTYYSLDRAAIIYGCTKKTLHEWIRTGKGEKIKFGSATFMRKI